MTYHGCDLVWNELNIVEISLIPAYSNNPFYFLLLLT